MCRQKEGRLHLIVNKVTKNKFCDETLFVILTALDYLLYWERRLSSFKDIWSNFCVITCFSWCSNINLTIRPKSLLMTLLGLLTSLLVMFSYILLFSSNKLHLLTIMATLIQITASVRESPNANQELDARFAIPMELSFRFPHKMRPIVWVVNRLINKRITSFFVAKAHSLLVFVKT